MGDKANQVVILNDCEASENGLNDGRSHNFYFIAPEIIYWNFKPFIRPWDSKKQYCAAFVNAA